MSNPTDGKEVCRSKRIWLLHLGVWEDQMRVVTELTLLVFGLAVLGMAAPARATSGAHFQKGDQSLSCTSTDPSGGETDAEQSNLELFWTECGVGQNTVNYTVSCSVSATYQCFNFGGNHPKAGNKETINHNATFPVPESAENGCVTVPSGINPAVIIDEPEPPSDFCPSDNWTLVLIGVTYSNCSLVDTSNGVTFNFPGSTSCP